MIQGINRNNNEKAYRDIFLDSSSSIKDFSFDRKKYLKKYLLNEIVEEKTNQAITIGKLTDCLLLEPEKFDSYFSMSICLSPPTGLMLEFVEALYLANKAATDDEGNITKTFEEMSREAYLASGFKIKYEAVIGKFIGSDSEIYYNEIREVRSRNLTVVTTNDVSNAERIVEELKTNFVTKDIVNLVDSSRWTVKNQFQIEGFEIEGHLMKAMIDKVLVDHQERIIKIYDLKCTWNLENFYEDYYLYRRAYLQGYVYFKAVISLTVNTESEYYGYTVLPPQFIVCDSINYYNPLIYKMNARDLSDAYIGFSHKGKEYPGINEILDDLKWALQENTWNISKKNYLNNGIVNIKGE